MQIALDEFGNRVHINKAIRGYKYSCPVCLSQVITKMGMKNIHHFAHIRREIKNCELLHHDNKTEWHCSWQNNFDIENQEVILKNTEGIYHIADILTSGNIVEFQHSPISSEEFEARNEFYTSLGYKVIWLFDSRNTEVDRRLFGIYRFHKENKALNAYEMDKNKAVQVFMQFKGEDNEQYDDESISIQGVLGKDKLDFKLGDEIDAKEFLDIANNKVTYSEIMERHKIMENNSKPDVLRRIMGRSTKEFIIARNIKNGYMVRVNNNNDNFCGHKIEGQIKKPGYNQFTSRIYIINEQNSSVWVES